MGPAAALDSLRALSVSPDSVDADTVAIVNFTRADTWKSLSLELWRFSTGDDPTWADPDFDDSGWRLLTTRTTYDSLEAVDWPGVGWWRIRIIADSAGRDWLPMLFLAHQAGASEAYLNGELVHRVGIPGPTSDSERSITREDVAPLDLKPGENLLAVRYSYTKAFDIYEIFGSGWIPGPSVVLTETAHWQFDRRPDRRFDSIKLYWIGGVLFMMFLSHLLLFLFFPADRTNLYFALFALFLLSLPVSETLSTSIPSQPLEGFWITPIVQGLTLASLVMLLAAVHHLFYRCLLKVFWPLAGAAVIAYANSQGEWLDVPLGLIVIAGIMLELLRVTVVSIWKKKEGGRIIGTGVVALVVLWVLGMADLLPGSTAGPMLALTFPISVSVLLATRAASRNRRLTEQQKLISRHAEELEEQVEARTSELKQSLEDLRNTQDQLVQSEKMASLGSLTAGIAHEIKNPLNFINNFAEVNQELAAELQEAIDKGEPIDDILADLRQNASVIAEHGKRADGIVRAMMQHARGGTGEREEVDINVLVNEYVGLAYHGKRAQVPDFNVTIEEDYDETVGKISIVPQDIGRVLVNILGNAFDAIHEKAQAATEGDGEPYSPTVSVSTERRGGRVTIRVADNGPGVPEEIRTKIFEPFFTTKPTGSGTGVGLSLSYDIVTKGHAGALRIETSPQGGAMFVIELPAG
jgi:signal transduction histidine kinase